MVFFGGNWRTINNNQNYYNSTDHPPREKKGERTHNKTGEQCPLLGDNDTLNSAKEHKGLSPVYEVANKNQAAADEDPPPPPPPRTNNQGHGIHDDLSEPAESDESSSSSFNNQQHHHHHHQSYIHSVLFGGLWTRNRLYEERDHHHGDEGDEEEDRPSLTSNFEVDSDLAVLRLCGLYAVLYVLMAVVAFSFVFEHWTIIDSMYFAVATFTTVGYGDQQPSTVLGQLFTIAFSVYGVIILGIFIGIFGHAISMGQQRALQRLNKGRQHHLLKLMFQREQKSNTTRSMRQKGFWGDQISLFQDCIDVVRMEFPEILAVVVFAMILGLREGWSFTSTLYFAVMSASTTGYGDYTPQSQIDKLYCVLFFPFSVAVFGEVLGRIASIYIQRRTREAETKHLQRALTHCDLRNMDADEDGMVSREEWLTFMLVMLQKVDRESIDQLKDIFQSIDRNGNGFIDKEDLVHLQETPQWKSIRKVSVDSTQ